MPVLLAALLLLAAAGSARASRTLEIPVPLAPGDFRIALPSPDGSRLAVMGGPGAAGREHTVLVVEGGCDAESLRVIPVSRSAAFVPAPEGVPMDFLRLQWSPEGDRLYAAGAVYALQEGEGEVSARKLRPVPLPVFDFRFGPGGKAAAVAFKSGKFQKISAGRESFVIRLEYGLYPLDKGLVLPIPPRETYGAAWIPEDWPQEPSLQWEPGGTLLIHYPYHDLTERYAPGKTRDAVEDTAPAPRPEPGSGPFTFETPCRAAWTLVSAPGSDRVRLKLD